MNRRAADETKGLTSKRAATNPANPSQVNGSEGIAAVAIEPSAETDVEVAAEITVEPTVDDGGGR